MIIYRDGKEIRLTLDEMQAAYKQMDHIYRLDTAEEYFRAKINYEEYEDNTLWHFRFLRKYGCTPEDAMNPDSPHYAMETLLSLFNELQTDYRCEDSIWDTAVQKLLQKMQEAQKPNAGKIIPVKIRFYAVMEDGFEYSEIREFEEYPSVKELEDMLREFKQEAEDMNDSVAVSFGSEYVGSAEKTSPVTIPDTMAAQFGTAEGRRKLMEAYGHINTAFSGRTES